MQEKTLGDLIEAARHVRSEKSLSYAELAKACGGKPTAARLQQYVTGALKNFPDPESILGLAKGTGIPPKEIILASARSLGLNIESDPEDLIFINGISTLPPSAAESLMSIGRELVNLSRKVDHESQDKPETNPPSKRTLRAVGPSGDAGQGQKITSGFSPSTIRALAFKARNSLLKAAGDRPGIITKANLDKALVIPEWYRQIGVSDDMLTDATAMRGFREILLREIGAVEAVRENFDRRPQSVEAHLDWLEAEFQKALRSDPAFLIPPPIEQLAAHPYFKTEHEKFEETYGERGEENQDPDRD